MELSSDQKGGIAELAIALAAARLDITVSRPMSEGARYDLIFDWHLGLQRVQCKWATEVNGTVAFRPLSCRRTAEGQLKRTYTPADVDAIAAYCPTLDDVWVVPIERITQKHEVRLRLTPAKNNQRVGVTIAETYRLGAIAQLGERVAGSHEVGGSSPPGSIARDLRTAGVPSSLGPRC